MYELFLPIIYLCYFTTLLGNGQKSNMMIQNDNRVLKVVPFSQPDRVANCFYLMTYFVKYFPT